MHFIGRLMMKEHLVVKIVAVYVVISFVVIEVLFLGVWCRPIRYYCMSSLISGSLIIN